MEKLKQKKFIILVSAVVLTHFLSACSGQSNNIENSKQASSSEDNEIESSKYQINKTSKLSIHPGCIGCGHCVRFDPEHFSFNGRGS